MAGECMRVIAIPGPAPTPSDGYLWGEPRGVTACCRSCFVSIDDCSQWGLSRRPGIWLADDVGICGLDLTCASPSPHNRGHVYIVDAAQRTRKGRVLVYDTNGQLVRCIGPDISGHGGNLGPVEGEVIDATDVAMLDSDTLLLSHCVRPSTVCCEHVPSRRFLEQFCSPSPAYAGARSAVLSPTSCLLPLARCSLPPT